jgi:protein-S-isoprenylcysteine O-methyltransferase Ste14
MRSDRRWRWDCQPREVVALQGFLRDSPWEAGDIFREIQAVFSEEWADRSLGRNLSAVVQIKEGHTLITTGPYSRVRHPIYTAAIIFCVGMFVVSGNWIVGACFMGPFVGLCLWRIPREERMMIEHFGDEYREYIERTGRLLPRVMR